MNGFILAYAAYPILAILLGCIVICVMDYFSPVQSSVRKIMQDHKKNMKSHKNNMRNKK